MKCMVTFVWYEKLLTNSLHRQSVHECLSHSQHTQIDYNKNNAQILFPLRLIIIKEIIVLNIHHAIHNNKIAGQKWT